MVVKLFKCQFSGGCVNYVRVKCDQVSLKALHLDTAMSVMREVVLAFCLRGRGMQVWIFILFYYFIFYIFLAILGAAHAEDTIEREQLHHGNHRQSNLHSTSIPKHFIAGSILFPWVNLLLYLFSNCRNGPKINRFTSPVRESKQPLQRLQITFLLHRTWDPRILRSSSNHLQVQIYLHGIIHLVHNPAYLPPGP